jgi:hypothetical protein
VSTFLTEPASTTLPWITAKLRVVTGTVRKAVNNSIAGFIAGRAFAGQNSWSSTLDFKVIARSQRDRIGADGPVPEYTTGTRRRR